MHIVDRKRRLGLSAANYWWLLWFDDFFKEAKIIYWRRTCGADVTDGHTVWGIWLNMGKSWIWAWNLALIKYDGIENTIDAKLLRFKFISAFINKKTKQNTTASTNSLWPVTGVILLTIRRAFETVPKMQFCISIQAEV